MSHMLVSSKLVEMVLAVFTMARETQKVRTYRDAEAFSATIREAVPGFSSLPSVPQPA